MGRCARVFRVWSRFPGDVYDDRSDDAERKTISINKAMELVGVSRRTIYNWITSRKVEYRRTAGGSVRIFVDTLWRIPENTTIPRHDRRAIAAAGSTVPASSPGRLP